MPQSIESALDAVVEAAAEAMATTAELARVLKQARAAATTGKLSDIEKSIEQAKERLDTVKESVANLESSWQFDAGDYFASGAYAAELLAAITEAGMNPVERDGRILSFPSILRVIPGDRSLEIDRKKERRVRPSVVASELRKHRDRQTGLSPDKLIEILHRIYEVLVAGQKGTRVVRVKDIHDLLTQLPQARDYSKQELARDLVRLDMSDVRTTRAGKQIKLRADTAARGSAVMSAVTPEGEVRLYSGVEFQ